jgi:SMODS-associating 2TM, beta-strand rich effector domain
MSFKYYKITPLIISIIILSGLIDYCVGEWINPLLVEYLSKGSHFRVPTTVSILGMFFLLYNQVLWKLPVFNLLMAVPNMAGRYEGKVKFKWNGADGEKPCFIEVVQTASKIKVHTYFSDGANERTSSKSLVEDIKQDEDGFFDIYLFYLNSGTKQNGGLDCHEGANKLRFHPDKDGSSNSLMGHYFTNRQIQTRGEIEGTLISNHLQGKF